MMSGSAGFGVNVYSLIAARARENPDRPALKTGGRQFSYGAMIAAADAIANGLSARQIERGDRVAVLSENSCEYALIQIACAKLGAIVACQNWRLSETELRYCLELVDASLLIASPRLREFAEKVAGPLATAVTDALEAPGATESAAEAEDALLIIYTSGTTGLPKAAAISHRAEIARMAATRLDMGIGSGDGYIAWAPMFHMGGSEHLLATLMSGGCGFILDGFDASAIVDIICDHEIGWLMLVPSTIEPLLAELAKRDTLPRGVRAVGCMADLVPANEIAAITNAVRAPYLNSFGSTETGMPPLSGGMLAIGATPEMMPKQLSVITELRLVNADGDDVLPGDIGEAWVRGPTVFSGYWNGPHQNAECFHDGWYRMGDLFRQTKDGYDFVGRSKYLIKSGGENIYPAEIERLILADARVADAIVVRVADDRWGEVPAAVIVRTDPEFDADTVETLLSGQLARYKKPRYVLFVDIADLPRSITGKILREDVETLVAERLAQ